METRIVIVHSYEYFVNTQVSSWITHLIISQPTHEDRKSILSCILRVALTCWNIGNFNGAMEIVAGLKYALFIIMHKNYNKINKLIYICYK